MASPPEFYADENSVTRSVRRLLTDLGYAFHSPAELYGSDEAALGARDEDWLARVSTHRWTVLGRDLKIFERPSELKAYQASKLQVFPLHRNVKREVMTQALQLTGAVTHEGEWHVARRLQVEVISQGETIVEALANLEEALELYFDDAPAPAETA